MSYQDSLLINTFSNDLGLAIVPDIYSRKRSRALALGENFLDILYEQGEQQQKRNCRLPTTYFAPSESFTPAFLGMQQVKDAQAFTFGNIGSELEQSTSVNTHTHTREAVQLIVVEEPEQVSYTQLFAHILAHCTHSSQWIPFHNHLKFMWFHFLYFSAVLSCKIRQWRCPCTPEGNQWELPHCWGKVFCLYACTVITVVISISLCYSWRVRVSSMQWSLWSWSMKTALHTPAALWTAAMLIARKDSARNSHQCTAQ